MLTTTVNLPARRAPSPQIRARDTSLDGTTNGSAGINSIPNVDTGINAAAHLGGQRCGDHEDHGDDSTHDRKFADHNQGSLGWLLPARCAGCGADTFGLQKPHPDLLRRTIARADGEPGRAVMVGDSISDIAAARAAGVPVIAVDYGYAETPVSELGPDRVISALAELPSAVFDLLRAGNPTAAERR
jgi:HAD-hyrolase-like